MKLEHVTPAESAEVLEVLATPKGLPDTEEYFTYLYDFNFLKVSILIYTYIFHTFLQHANVFLQEVAAAFIVILKSSGMVNLFLFHAIFDF